MNQKQSFLCQELVVAMTNSHQLWQVGKVRASSPIYDGTTPTQTTSSIPEVPRDFRASDFLKVNPMKLASFDVNICNNKQDTIPKSKHSHAYPANCLNFAPNS